ncbi:MAG TPA: outer membrane lipid asymmetry maintenance protein MlaD, partial [Alphaproteobacteria bacterium]|nr:outer membrane lipid asymmetry maintenance protein MlaD [Alphaproteobacteria bacterium]
MGRSVFETILGAVVLGLAATFLAFAYSRSNIQTVAGYTVSADFTSVDGIKEGTDVKMNGVRVGAVSALKLITKPGPDQFLVDVKMSIRPDVKLPDDTIAMVATESLLGGKYMSLEPGVDDELIPANGTGKITHTQAGMNLDSLIGQLIYSSHGSGGGGGNNNGDTGGGASSATPSVPAPATAPAKPAKPAKPA